MFLEKDKKFYTESISKHCECDRLPIIEYWTLYTHIRTKKKSAYCIATGLIM